MKLSNFIWGALITFVVLWCVWSVKSQAAAYDIKPDIQQQAITATDVDIKADKVMDGIIDVTFNLGDVRSKTKQRIILQCDTTTQSLNVFYYLDDTTGFKAKGATNFMINVYDGPDAGYKAGGDITIFDGVAKADNLRRSVERLNKLGGVGYVSFEFYESNGEIRRSPVAHSMLFPSTWVTQILKAFDQMPGTEGCNINGGFTSVYPLKNLTDQV